MHPEVARLAEIVEKAFAANPDPLWGLASSIRDLVDQGIDPYHLIGILLEGAAHALRNGVPAERQGEVALAMIKIMVDRFDTGWVEL
jgi:hypothetical protein